MTSTFRIRVAYDGTGYAGWQVQPDATTVQGVLERAAERLNGEPTRILGAGRTDAGVHAFAQAARFTTSRSLDANRVPGALNAFLPEDVAVRGATRVNAGFHPIRDARGKHYRYTFKVGAFDDPFDRRYVLRVEEPLQIDAMRAAAGALTGKRDFELFEKRGSPRDTTVRDLRQLDVEVEGDYIQLHLVADGFLYGMARNLAGTLLRVGRGSLDAASLERRFADGEREIAGPCLPPHGLCLINVTYDDPQGRITE